MGVRRTGSGTGAAGPAATRGDADIRSAGGRPRGRRALFAVLAAGLGAGWLGASAAYAAPPAPAVHYAIDADDVSSGRVTDSSGNGLDGTLVNPGTAALVDGPHAGDPALQLPGGTNPGAAAYVRLPRGVLAGRTDLTVSERVKWAGSTTAWQRLFDLGSDTGHYLFATPYSGNATLRTAITAGGAGGEAQVNGSAPLPGDAWKTVTVTLDTAAHKVTMYLDGAAVDTASTSVTPAQLLGDASFSGYVGRSFYPDPLLKGAVDDFSVYGVALSPAEVAEIADVTPPVPTAVKRDSFDVRTTVGTAPDLPDSATAKYSDDYDRQLPISWDAVDPSEYAQRGTFTVNGTAGRFAVHATVTVIRPGELTIDLGKDTGAFHGGASGSLYGLYGPGVPTNNIIEGMRLRTVATKAQDGPQHPGADALEVVKPLVDSTGGDVYIYMTDIHRGFPYEWPGSTPEEKLSLYKQKIATQVDQVLTLDPSYQRHIVFVPFNEPEGNMFGTGDWSLNHV